MSEIRVRVNELAGGTHKDPWTLFLLVQNDKPIYRMSAREFCHIFDNERREWDPARPEVRIPISNNQDDEHLIRTQQMD